MKQTQSSELHKYWKEIYTVNGVPERSQIEPMAIRDILGDTFILEFEDNGDINYRLAGTRLCAMFGEELKTRSFCEPWQKDGQETIKTIVRSAASESTIAVFGSVSTSQKGRSLSLETLILPLLQNGKKSRRMLGITTPMSRPYWLGIDPVVQMRLTSLRIIEPKDHAGLINTRFSVFRTKNPTPVPTSVRFKKVKHLRVLDGGLSMNKIDQQN